MLLRLVHIVRIALVLAVVLSTQGLLLVQGTFLLRQDYIAEVLCVNQNLPELDCEGKCFLADRMREQQKHDEEQKGFLEVALAVAAVAVTQQELAPPDGHERPWMSVAPSAERSGHQAGVFHPPRA